jgi:hypothetical protein
VLIKLRMHLAVNAFNVITNQRRLDFFPEDFARPRTPVDFP